MMDRIKEILGIIAGSSLSVAGTGRTFVKVPMWLAVVAVLTSPHLAIITALLIIAFGMRVSIQKA